ncbi:hypothetical protein KCP76_20295 [Salmonella enterica subsp. enterica serovar Weltevreden]|nr:hypothetical protein KCP76_20295 [Salmonella enterica subsp. enterica serovar Weltevreden]
MSLPTNIPSAPLHGDRSPIRTSSYPASSAPVRSSFGGIRHGFCCAAVQLIVSASP